MSFPFFLLERFSHSSSFESVNVKTGITQSFILLFMMYLIICFTELPILSSKNFLPSFSVLFLVLGNTLNFRAQ